MRLASEDPLSATFFALADPTRRAILTQLSRGAATVKEISAPFAISGPAISRHLRVLERAGLIQRGREAPPIRQVADWAGEFRRFWDASYDRLDNYLDLLKKEEKRNAKRS
jgi:DNA-binding transcriptional ArsR family regulator